MEVIRFRESLSNDKAAWPKSWHVLDEELGSLDETVDTDTLTARLRWPSTKLDRRDVEAQCKLIWDTYLADEALTQICVPHAVVWSTLRRMRMLAAYGPEVFGQALLDPVRTIQRDTLPRFLNSPMCTDMLLRIDSLKSLPSAATFRVSAPSKSLITTQSLEYFEKSRRFSLDDILHDCTLYGEFLTHLRNSVQSENLLCVRMVEIFEEMFDEMQSATEAEKDMENSTRDLIANHAWSIFKYFVAPSSAFEVSLYSRHKKEIMLNLATPHREMFSELKKSAMSMLLVNFNEYKTRESYQQLAQMMREEKSKSSITSRLSISNLLWRKK